MIESWGRGIEKILAACFDTGLPAPQFKDDGTGFWVTFFFKKQIDKDDRVGDRVGDRVDFLTLAPSQKSIL